MTQQTTTTVVVKALGGTAFEVAGVRFESGRLDAAGQWVETDDLETVAREAAGLADDVEIRLPF